MTTRHRSFYQVVKLLIACLLMLISIGLAAIEIYNRYNPPEVENVQKPETERDYREAPLRSGTGLKKNSEVR